MELLRGIKEIESLLNRKLVSCDFEILLMLHSNKSLSAKDIFSVSRYSGTTFYAVLKQLGDGGYIVGSPAKHDRRLILYNLSDRVREEMSNRLFAPMIDRALCQQPSEADEGSIDTSAA